jgi:hypothetical protein
LHRLLETVTMPDGEVLTVRRKGRRKEVRLGFYPIFALVAVKI